MQGCDIDPIDMAAVIADLDRRRASLLRMQDEIHKRIADGHKRDRWMLPLSMLLTVLGSIIMGILISLPDYLRLFGWAP